MFSPKKLTTQSSFTTSTSTPNTTTTTSNKPASANSTRTSSTQPTLGRGIKTLSMTSTSTVPSYDGFNQPMLNGSSSITSPTAAAAASRTKGLKASNRTKSSINSPNPIRRTRSKLLSATSSNASSTSTALTGLTVSAPGSPSNATTSSSYVQPPSPSNLSVSPKKPLTVNTSAPPSPTAGVTSTFSPQPDAYPSVPSSPIASASPTARRMKSHQSRLAAFPAPSTSTSTTSGNQPSITSPTGAQAQAQAQAQQKKTVLPRKLDTSLSAEADTQQHQPSPKTTLFSPLYKLHDEDGKEIKVDGESKRGSTGAVQPKVKATRKDKKLDAQAAREVEAANAAAQQVYQHQHAHHHHVVYATTEQPTPDPQHTTVVPTVSYTPVIEEDDFDPFLFIKNLPPLSPAVRNRRSPLPKKLKTAPRISLALDLDETLVHCSVQPIEKAELTFSVSFNGLDYEVYVRTRPHLKEFLETVSQWFEIIVFTASQKVYADKLLNILDPHSKYIQHRVFRDSCVCIDGNYLKDLTILGRELPTVAIVDNSVQAFGFQLDNGIPIESWFDDDQDRELLNLLPFLQNLKEAKDVRPIIRDTFRLQEFVNSL